MTIPVAGEYVIGGKNWNYTEFLHTPTPSEIVNAWQKAGLAPNLRILSSGDVIDLDAEFSRTEAPSVVSNRFYSHSDRVDFAKSRSDCGYVIDEFQIPSTLKLPPSKVLQHLNKARVNLGKFQLRESISFDSTLTFEVPNLGLFRCDLSETDSHFVEISKDTLNNREADLRVTLSYEYLYALLTGHVHWNNLEISNHLLFRRTPEEYIPNLHHVLSFFHL